MADDLTEAVAREILAIDWPPLWELPQDQRDHLRSRIIAGAAIAAVRAWDAAQIAARDKRIIEARPKKAGDAAGG
jgi:hypothetical protein